ncbi:MAG: FHA domain-containing protein, partial [Woeseiaceae bacterium]
MKFDDLYIRDLEGERRIAASQLPLRVGTGTDCAVRLPGPGGAPVALLDLLDGVPFVQPVGRDTALTLNGEPLETSRRLQGGDEMLFFGSRIQVLIDGERVLLDVKLEDSAYVTKPPQLADDDIPDDEAIAPTAFRRAAATAAQAEISRKSPLKMVLGSGLAMLLFASYLLFSSKSVDFEIDPRNPDEFNIDGGWFRLPIGDRTLLRKGSYSV